MKPDAKFIAVIVGFLMLVTYAVAYKSVAAACMVVVIIVGMIAWLVGAVIVAGSERRQW